VLRASFPHFDEERLCRAYVGTAALVKAYQTPAVRTRRAAAARRLRPRHVADPAVLLLDEPLSNLDAALRDQMRAELPALQRRLKVTTIYVTHDHTEALSMSDRIAVLKEGRIVEIGTPDALYNRPRTAFTAQLIGGANIVEGLVVSAAGGMTRVDITFGPLLSTDRGGDTVFEFNNASAPDGRHRLAQDLKAMTIGTSGAGSSPTCSFDIFMLDRAARIRPPSFGAPRQDTPRNRSRRGHGRSGS